MGSAPDGERAGPGVVRAVDGKAVVGNVEVALREVIGGGAQVVGVAYRNTDPVRVWRFSGPIRARLTDEHGNDYRLLKADGDEGDEQVLEPGEIIYPAYRFEKVDEDATRLTLTLEIRTIEGIGAASFSYDRSFIQKPED